MRFNCYESFGPYRYSFDYRENFSAERLVTTFRIMGWCTEQYGDQGPRWYYNPVISAFRIALNDDAFAFRMRWC